MASLNEDLADVVNDNGRSKVTESTLEVLRECSLIFSVHKLAKAFKCSPWRTIMVEVTESTPEVLRQCLLIAELHPRAKLALAEPHS